MFAPHDRQAPGQDAKVAIREPQRLTEMSALVVSPMRNRKLQAGLDVARPKQLHSPVPVKGLLLNPTCTNEFQNVQESHINCLGWTEPPQSAYQHRLHSQILHHSSAVSIPHQTPARSNSNEPALHRTNSQRNHKDQEQQRRGGKDLVLELSPVKRGDSEW